MRWRTEEEVKLGKGQFMCGSRKCSEAEMMRTWEVNFAYIEAGEKKNALVKVIKPLKEKNVQRKYDQPFVSLKELITKCKTTV